MLFSAAVSTLPVSRFFPLPTPREKQTLALDFIDRAVAKGYRHIVVAAPTGSGKTGIGCAACFWASASGLDGRSGGYYLVTQRMLQDQIERDLPGFKEGCRSGASLKSASEYLCPTFKSCAIGMGAKKKKCALGNSCYYHRAKEAFVAAPLAVTNYPYMLTERMHAARLEPRQVIVCDEAHSLEKQLLNHVGLVVSETTLDEWRSTLTLPDNLQTLEEFVRWVEQAYLDEVVARAAAARNLAEDGDEKMAVQAIKLEQHASKVKKFIELIRKDPSDWIFWTADDPHGKKEYIARPLNAAPFSNLVTDMGQLRIYMSAFMGNKQVFCRSLGLDPNAVAWISLSSTFPVRNRPIIVGSVGSMSRRNIAGSLPRFLKTLTQILDKHAAEKGLIHSGSYALARTIAEHLRATPHAPRLIFPQKADEREAAFVTHCTCNEPTVLLTPSMTEGFDFTGDLATWQVIAKVPYPSLSDRQVVAKKEQDPDWYGLETVKGIIQAAGRIVRSDTDRGYTYVLDSDFEQLYRRYKDFFPKWFVDAFVYPPAR